MESILIVDDDIQLGTVLRDELAEVGYEAEFIDSGEEALQYLAAKPVDVILLDLNMPGKNGFDVLKYLYDSSSPSRVIVLTAYADVKSAIDSAKMGAKDFISKPYDFDELLISIRKVIQRDT